MIAAGPAGWAVFWFAVAVLLVLDIAAVRGSARSLRRGAADREEKAATVSGATSTRRWWISLKAVSERRLPKLA
jgi:hypothetical protein